MCRETLAIVVDFVSGAVLQYGLRWAANQHSLTGDTSSYRQEGLFAFSLPIKKTPHFWQTLPIREA